MTRPTGPGGTACFPPAPAQEGAEGLSPAGGGGSRAGPGFCLVPPDGAGDRHGAAAGRASRPLGGGARGCGRAATAGGGRARAALAAAAQRRLSSEVPASPRLQPGSGLEGKGKREPSGHRGACFSCLAPGCARVGSDAPGGVGSPRQAFEWVKRTARWVKQGIWVVAHCSSAHLQSKDGKTCSAAGSLVRSHWQRFWYLQ